MPRDARAGKGPIDPRLLRHARASRAGIALLTLVGIGQAAATIAIALSLTWIVAGSGLLPGVASGDLPAGSVLGGTSAPWAGTALLAGAFAVRGLLAWAEQVVAQRTAARVTDELRRSLLDRIVRRGPAWVAAFGAGRLSNVLGTGLEALRPWFSGYLPALILGVLLPPLVVLIMALVDPASATIALFTLPLIPVLGALIGWATKARAEQRWAADARLAGHFLDVVRGLATLRMYGRAERQTDVIADLTDRHRTATLRVLRVAFLSSTALDLVGTLSVGLIAVQAGLRVAAGAMDLGPALLVILLAPEAYRPLREMAARYHASTDAGAVIADVDTILTEDPSSSGGLITPGAPAPSSASATSGAYAISSGPTTTGNSVAHGNPATTTTCATSSGPTTTGNSVAHGNPATTTTRGTCNAASGGPATTSTPASDPGATSATSTHGPSSGPAVAGTTALPGHRSSTGAESPLDDGVGSDRPGTTLERPRYGEWRREPFGPENTSDFAGGRVFAGTAGGRTDAGDQADPGTGGGRTATGTGGGRTGTGTGGRAVEAEPFDGGAVAGLEDARLRRAVRQVFGVDGRWGVRVAGLRATYPGASGDAVRLDELGVRAGELVALRGVSGAGKTTALRVLAGLHPAEAGAIAVGRTLYLPQRSTLPHARTVAEAFPPEATREEVRTALRRTGLAAEIAPETPLGEHVTGISAGQRQRLALAVLLHRADRSLAGHRSRTTAPVVTLLLDEPTAHLDLTTELLIIDRLREFAARGCAVLVVAHRPALLAAADRVVDLHPPTGGILQLGASAAGGRWFSRTVTATVHPDGEQPSWATLGSAPPPAGPLDGAPARTGSVSPDATGTPTAPAAGIGSEGGTGAPAPGGAGRGWLRRPATAVLLGAASSMAGIVLTGAAAWLLVRASSLPPVLSLSAAVVLVRGSAVARPLLRYLERLVAHDVAFARLGRRRARVYADLIPHVPGPRLHRRGDLLTRLVDDVDARVDGLLRGRLPAVAAAVTAGVCLAVVAWFVPVVAVPLAFGLLVAGVLAPAVAAWQADRQEAATGTARAELRDAMVETVDGVEELAAGGGRPGVPQRRSRTLADLEARAARWAGLAAAIAHVGWGVAVAGVAVVLAGGMSSAEWSAVTLLGAVVLGEAVVALPEAAIARRRAAGAERRVATLTATSTSRTTTEADGDAPTTDDTTTDAIGGTVATDGTTSAGGHATTTDETGSGLDGHGACRPAVPNSGGAATGVRVSGLVAGWDAGRAAVLDGLDLRLPAGSRTAVVGRSGCGKSTLAAVLAGLLEPRAGTVHAGGTAVLVGDETGHVFASTVRENLRLAAPAASDDRLVAALRRVGLAGLALDTWLGTGGSTLSGGQRRRLATGRALLADPDLLILDEPTEGIDEAGATDLMADLLDAASGRTVLVLAHRSEGLDRVDRILVLDGGRLGER